MAIAPGVRVGPYEIVGPLGAGGMGEVWRARDPRLRREVAVKVVSAQVGADPERLRRFKQEALAAGALNHPNLLSVYDVGEHAGAPYLVFELLEGQSLGTRLAEGRPPLRRSVEWAAQAARGLAAAHDRGIVHRDVKPDNLFVLTDGRVKVLDFGLAKLHPGPLGPDSGSAVETRSQLTDPGTILGTVAYMSPEQVRAGAVDSRSDLFSLGSVLHEMLTGRRPFVGDTAVETMNAILKEDPPELSASGAQVPPVLDRIVKRCLEKSADARFRSAHDLAFALEAVEGSGESTMAGAPPVTPGRRRWLPALAAATALAALAWGLPRWLRPVAAPPIFERITWRRGIVHSARFAADGQSIVYGASWEGLPPEVYITQRGTADSRPLGFTPGNFLALSAKGELALSLEPRFLFTVFEPGVLARAPLTGGAARRLLGDVNAADWTPDGSNLAIVRLSDDLDGCRIEFPLGTQVFETATDTLSNLRVSPQEGRLAFLAHGPASSRVMVLEGRAEPRELVSGLDLRSVGLAWTPSGREIYFTAARGLEAGTLSSVDLAGHERVLLRVPGGLRVQDVSKDGQVLMIHLRLRRQMRYGAGEGASERDLSWFTESHVNDLSVDGREILFSEPEVGSNEDGRPVFALYVRPIDGGPALKLAPGVEMSGSVISPDGSKVAAVRRGGDRILLVPTREGETMELPPGPVKEYARAEWMPDGKRVLLSGRDEQGWRIFIQDTAAGPPRPVTPKGFTQPRAAPDGEHFAAFSPEGLVIVPLDGGSPRPVPSRRDERRLLRFGRDGRSLFAADDGPVPAHLYRIDVATGREELIRTLMPPDPAGVWRIQPIVGSPDGAYAYTARQDFSDLYVVSGIR